MASSIAASTSGGGGLISTADASGNLNLVSGTTTIVAMTSAGIAVTGTLSSTGITTVAAGTAALPAIVSTTGTADTGIWFPAADTIAASTGGTERMRINSSGNLLVGTTSAVGLIGGIQASTSAYAGYFTSSYTAVGNANIMLWGREGAAVTAAVRYKDASTSMEFYSPTGHTVAYTTSSDYRIKDNIQPMTGALASVMKLNPVTYLWKEGFGVGGGQGFIAHELSEVCPNAVTGEKDAVDAEGKPKYQGIDTSFLVATLTAAIQELKAIIDTQAAHITALNAKVGI